MGAGVCFSTSELAASDMADVLRSAIERAVPASRRSPLWCARWAAVEAHARDLDASLDGGAA